MIDLIGYAAAFCTTFAFIPQALKVYKTKRTNDISLGMFVLMSSGVFGWLIYGILLNAWPVIAANTVTFLLAFFILVLKIRYDVIPLRKKIKR